MPLKRYPNQITKPNITQMTEPEIKYTDGLVPVIVQDTETKQILMFAYADKKAVELTKTTGYAHYFSRSRNKIWKKGEESGHLQKISDILIDCDNDTLLYIVEQTGCACHEGYKSCFFRKIDGQIILPRLKDPSEIYSRK